MRVRRRHPLRARESGHDFSTPPSVRTLAKHGLSSQAWKDLREHQGTTCAICKEPGALMIDHEHLDGFVRGLLCNRCNLALGLFEDDPELIRKAAGYLEAGWVYVRDRSRFSA